MLESEVVQDKLSYDVSDPYLSACGKGVFLITLTDGVYYAIALSGPTLGAVYQDIAIVNWPRWFGEVTISDHIKITT